MCLGSKNVTFLNFIFGWGPPGDTKEVENWWFWTVGRSFLGFGSIASVGCATGCKDPHSEPEEKWEFVGNLAGQTLAGGLHLTLAEFVSSVTQVRLQVRFLDR